MTQPSQARQSGDRDAPRTYAWPPQPPHEFEVISVTSALKLGLPKPFLIGWAAKKAAECAVDDHEIVAAMLAKGNQKGAISYIKEARYRDMDDKADRGTIVHAALEAYVDGKPLDREEINERLEEARVPREMWKSTFGMIKGVLDYFETAQPEVFQSESTVYSRKHGYAGTLDLCGVVNVGDSRCLAVIDVKTSKRIYDEVSLQLSAYARADFVGLDDGTEAPITPTGEIPQYGVVVRPMASGKFEQATFALTDDVYELFLSCLKTASLLGVESRARRPS